MKTANSFRKILNFVFTALLVVACGSGGGSFNPAPPAAGISITAANAELITVTIVNSVDVVEGVALGSNILTGVSVNAGSSGFNYPDFFVKQLERLPVLASQSNSGSVTGVVIPKTTHECTEIGGASGTYTESGNVSDPSTVSVGDMISVDFNNCVIYDVVLNGTIALTITTITPDFDGLPPYTLGIDAVLSAFSVNDAGFIITSDGDISILLDESISGDLYTELSGTSLSASADSVNERLTNYQYDISGNDISGDFSVDLIGTIATTAIGGSVSYETTASFTGNDFIGTSDPTAGVMHITTSTDNSQALVTALPDGINVQIKVDADGDSLYEATVMTTWTALHNP